MPGKRILVGMHQLHLPGRRRGLQILEARAPLVDTQYGTANRDRTRGHDQQLMAVGFQLRDIVGERPQPVPIQPARRVNEERGADLDDQPAVVGERHGGHVLADEQVLPIE